MNFELTVPPNHSIESSRPLCPWKRLKSLARPTPSKVMALSSLSGLSSKPANSTRTKRMSPLESLSSLPPNETPFRPSARHSWGWPGFEELQLTLARPLNWTPPQSVGFLEPGGWSLVKMIGMQGTPGALIFAPRRKMSADASGGLGGVLATFLPQTVAPASTVRVTFACTKVVPSMNAEQSVSQPPHFWMWR